MKLYEFGPTRSIRARWALQELEVEFEAITINLLEGQNQSPEYLKINPAGKLPALVDDDFVLTESVAIVVYLAEKYPHKRLLPSDPKLRAQLNRWMLFTVTELEQPLWRIARHSFLYPEEQRIVADIDIARSEFRNMAAVLERHMQGRHFLVGEHATVGDFIVAYTLDWGNEEKLLGDYPALLAHMQRMYDRPKAPMRIAAAAASVGL